MLQKCLQLTLESNQAVEKKKIKEHFNHNEVYVSGIGFRIDFFFLQ